MHVTCKVFAQKSDGFNEEKTRIMTDLRERIFYKFGVYIDVILFILPGYAQDGVFVAAPAAGRVDGAGDETLERQVPEHLSDRFPNGSVDVSGMEVALVITDKPAVDAELAAMLKEAGAAQIVTMVVSGTANALGQINEISEGIKRINPDIVIVDITSNATGLAESILSLPGVNAVVLPEQKDQWRAVLTEV